MIYVTHDQVEAMTMGDRIVVMKDGLIQQVDAPIALYNNPKNMFVAGFIGSPPMNFFEGTIEQRTGALWFVEKYVAGKGFAVRVEEPKAAHVAAYAGKPIMFGIRPEDINDRQLAHQADPNHIATATVEVVEPMGAEIYLMLTTGANAFTARLDSHDRARVGQNLEMVFEMKKCHFFDPATKDLIV
jgi:multiple sugar transport system ATP-binding protein